jgi:diketogulonate reductase-like aldo/keto reductase
MAASPNAILSAQRHTTDAFSPLTFESTLALPTGNAMPVLGLGTWHLKHHTVDSISGALGVGFRMLDTSGDYHTQRGIGEALKTYGAPRESLYVVTKIDQADDAHQAVCRNLAELRLDYADLVLVNRPPERGVGESLWQELRRVKRAGLARDIGVSNYSIEQIEELVYRTGELPAVNQVEWSPFGHSPGMLDFCHDNHIVLQAHSPLTRGARLNDDKLAAMAARYGKTAAQLLIRWNLQLGVVPLPKANHAHHQRDNLNVFDFEISQPDMAKLRAFNEHYSALGGLQYV